MTVTAGELGLYALAMLGLWSVPGPVWVALIARSMAGGFRAAWPLAVGVAIGDLVWPLVAVLGLGWAVGLFGDFLVALRWVAAAIFLVMGVLLLRAPGRVPGADSRLTRPGLVAGFSVGLAAVIGNPKAMLFYMGALPGFFRLEAIGPADVLAIGLISALVPMAGNLALALFLDRARRLLSSPAAMRRINIGAGALLIAVAGAIPFL
ncbi:MAG: LysE family translocator [Rubellimicrobium sp.]|nr:LysE family translocator [Rubellimicrobium sp.]